MSLIPFLISLVVTTLFVLGSWRLVCAFGATGNRAALNAAMNFVIGLALKFPGVIYILKIVKSPITAERNGAFAAVCLVYFSTVVALSIHGFRQNRRTDDGP